MVYIPYPRLDLNTHPDLVLWRHHTGKTSGCWKELKDFLADQPRFSLDPRMPALPKCWYSELPLGDDYSIDVEHFRPKRQASPLSPKMVKVIQRKIPGFHSLQELSESAYPWLEFDYRNYRLVTAMTNRAGAKHIYFPILSGTSHLPDNECPWNTTYQEYPLFLDPTNPYEAELLLVLPNGEIIPKTPASFISQSDLDDLPISWHTPGFDYLRAVVTIELFRLNSKIFVNARNEKYRYVNTILDRIWKYSLKVNNKYGDFLEDYIADIAEAASPAAPFALAARCALEAYLAPTDADLTVQDRMNAIPKQILSRIKLEIEKRPCDWNNS